MPSPQPTNIVRKSVTPVNHRISPIRKRTTTSSSNENSNDSDSDGDSVSIKFVICKFSTIL